MFVTVLVLEPPQALMELERWSVDMKDPFLLNADPAAWPWFDVSLAAPRPIPKPMLSLSAASPRLPWRTRWAEAFLFSAPEPAVFVRCQTGRG